MNNMMQELNSNYLFSGLAIASQCPYKGGKAVYRSRAFVALFDDQVVYNDLAQCSLQGIYRNSTPTSTPIFPQIRIVPNPANQKFEIFISGTLEGICKVEVKDVLGENLLNKEFNCSNRSQQISSSQFTPGVYTVIISLNNNYISSEKLIIIR